MDYSKLTPEELVKLLQDKDQQIADSEGVITELKSDLAKKDDELMTLSPIVEVGKDRYEVAIPVFKLYDVKTQAISEHTASDVLKDAKLAAALVKQGSGVLRKIEK